MKIFEKNAFYLSSEYIDKDLLSKERRSREKNQMDVIKGMIKGLSEVPYINVSSLHVPTLIIEGKYDKITPIQAVFDFYQKLPHVQFQIIDHASHMVLLESPKRVNELISAFLAGV